MRGVGGPSDWLPRRNARAVRAVASCCLHHAGRAVPVGLTGADQPLHSWQPRTSHARGMAVRSRFGDAPPIAAPDAKPEARRRAAQQPQRPPQVGPQQSEAAAGRAGIPMPDERRRRHELAPHDLQRATASLSARASCSKPRASGGGEPARSTASADRTGRAKPARRAPRPPGDQASDPRQTHPWPPALRRVLPLSTQSSSSPTASARSRSTNGRARPAPCWAACNATCNALAGQCQAPASASRRPTTTSVSAESTRQAAWSSTPDTGAASGAGRRSARRRPRVHTPACSRHHGGILRSSKLSVVAQRRRARPRPRRGRWGRPADRNRRKDADSPRCTATARSTDPCSSRSIDAARCSTFQHRQHLGCRGVRCGGACWLRADRAARSPDLHALLVGGIA